MSLKKKILEKISKTKDFLEDVKKNEVPEMKKSLTDFKDRIKELDPLSLLLSGLHNIDLFDWYQKIIHSSKDLSQKVKDVDKEDLRKKMEEMSPRTMDKSEDFFKAWDNLKEKSENDAFSEEVVDFLKTLLEELSFQKGLPFTAESFEAWSKFLSDKRSGLKQEDFQNLFTLDGIELLSTSLGMVSALFALKREDEEKLAEILGTLGITSLMTVNPPLALTIVFVSGYAFFYKKLTFDKKAFTKSTVLTFSNFSSFALMSALGLSFTSRLLLVGLVSQTLKKEVLENEEFIEALKKHLEEQKLNMRDILENNPQVVDLIHEIKERSLNVKKFFKI
jgi:acyl-CoA-binding protein